jgi:MFS family permease
MATWASVVVVARVAESGPLRRVLASYLAFHIAEFSTWVAILLYAYETTGPTSVGFVALLQLVPAALVATPAAALGDRYPRERVLRGGYLAQAVAMLATGAAMLAGLPVPIVYAAAAVAASSLVITRPTQSALLPSIARTPDELTASNAAAGVVEGFGVLLGPLIAAVVLTQASIGAVFLIAGVALIAAALGTLGLRPSGGLAAMQHREAELPGVPHEDVADPSFLAGLRTVAEDADARLVVGLLTARMLIVGCADVLFVLLALELLGMGAPGAGVLNAALGAGIVVGGAAAFALIGRSGLAMAAALGAGAWALAIGLVGITALPSLAPVLIVVGGAGLTVVDVAGRTILQRTIRDEVLARVFGIQEGLAMAALAAGSILVSVVAGTSGLAVTIAIVAGILPLTVLATWSRLIALDRRGGPPLRALHLLRATSLFRPLAPPQLEAIARRGQWLPVPSGVRIIDQGDQGDRYYVLAEGAVRVDQDGRHLRDLERTGDGFGEIALLRDVPRTASVTTTRESILFAIDRAPFLAAITGHPAAFAAAQEAAAVAADEPADVEVGPA